MSSATKVQFSAGTAPSQPAPPGKAATTALSTGLQALHESLRDNEVITGLALKFMRLFILLKSKETSLKKFDDETYIPTSCRVKVDLKGSHRISKSDKFAELTTSLTEINRKYMKDSAKVFLSVGNLELELIRQELAEMAVAFANLLMKQKLLTHNDCRDHSKSHELITAVFIREPNNHASVEDMETDQLEGVLESINSSMETLRFDTNDEFIYKALAVTPITSGQPPSLTENEFKFIWNIKKDLKNTLFRGVRAFSLQVRKIKNINQTKEILLETLTASTADGTATALNGDGEKEEGIELPADVSSLRDLIGSVMLEKMNDKKTTQHKSKSDLKDQRGAKKHHGGGASSNTNASTKKKKKEKAKKKKKAAAAKVAKKKATKATAVVNDSDAVNSNKRRRPASTSS